MTSSEQKSFKLLLKFLFLELSFFNAYKNKINLLLGQSNYMDYFALF